MCSISISLYYTSGASEILRALPHEGGRGAVVAQQRLPGVGGGKVGLLHLT